MKRILPLCLALCALGISCSEKEPSDQEKYDTSLKTDTRTQFRHAARQQYNNREFAALEKLADEVRASKGKFEDGSWKIEHLYEALECREDEPESMWELHEKIHGDWKTEFPKSVTAQIAHADFLASWAWQARGADVAAKVTEEGWRLFRERLAEGRKILEGCESSAAAYPRWASVRMRIGLGQEMPRADYKALYDQAVAANPDYFPYDIQLAKYLLPRWYGQPGEWEKAAEDAIARPGGLGHEIYARVVQARTLSYNNIFQDSAASWRKTRRGFEEMQTRYPGSTTNLNKFCRMACVAGDSKLANQLFAKIGGDYEGSCWRTRREFESAKSWAAGT